MSIDFPGHLRPIFYRSEWKDIFYKSRLSAEHKLVGDVIAGTCTYKKSDKAQVSAVTTNAISRILNLGPRRVEELVQDLVKYGWIFDTERRIGARKVFALTMSTIPLGEPKT